MLTTILLSSFISSISAMKCDFEGWEIQQQCGDIPPISAQSNFVSSKDDLYLILGFNECFNIASGCDNFFYPYDTIYKYDTKRNNWKSISVNNPTNVPDGRAFAGVDITEDDGDIIVYGGANYNNFFGGPGPNGTAVFYDDLWKYSIDDNEWTKLVPSNPANDPNVPGGLSLVGLVANEDFVYIFGGFTFSDPNFTGQDELFRFEFATNTWTKLTTTNTPPGRGVFGMEWSQDNDDIFYIYGGERFGGFQLVRDLWKFDTTTNTWTELTSTITPDAANYGAFAVLKDDDFIMAFGETNDPATECLTPSIINQAHSLSTDTYKYEDGEWELQDSSVFVPGLKRPAYTYNRRRKNVYVYGGVNIVCNGGDGVDIYNRNMYMLDV